MTNSFEKALEVCKELGHPITEEEFLRIYNLPYKEYSAEVRQMEQEDFRKYATFKHLFVAYHSSYPQKREEWDKKWANFKR